MVGVVEEQTDQGAAPKNERQRWETLLLQKLVKRAEYHPHIRREENQMEPDERKLLAALLALAMKMITINLLPNDGTLIPVDSTLFVKKLKEILERNKEPTPDCLNIVRATTKLSIWAVMQNHITGELFRLEKFGEALNEAVKMMSKLEECVLLTGSVPDIANYETLPSLVQRANGLIGTTVVQASQGNANWMRLPCFGLCDPTNIP